MRRASLSPSINVKLHFFCRLDASHVYHYFVWRAKVRLSPRKMHLALGRSYSGPQATGFSLLTSFFRPRTFASTLRSTSCSHNLHITCRHAAIFRLLRLHHRWSRAKWTCATTIRYASSFTRVLTSELFQPQFSSAYVQESGNNLVL